MSFSGFFAAFRAKMQLLCFAKTGFDFMLSFTCFYVKTGLEPCLILCARKIIYTLTLNSVDRIR